jgi:pimeloyl-ACP methyl ester carboxylesterase
MSAAPSDRDRRKARCGSTSSTSSTPGSSIRGRSARPTSTSTLPPTAFEAYRAFGQDAEDNRRLRREKGKLTIPVLALGGAISTAGAVIEEMTREVAEDVTAARIPHTGHWIAEENPEAVIARLLDFAAE